MRSLTLSPSLSLNSNLRVRRGGSGDCVRPQPPYAGTPMAGGVSLCEDRSLRLLAFLFPFSSSPKLGVSLRLANLLNQPRLMATPQGRSLGYHTPEQVSNQEPPDSGPGVLTTMLLGGATCPQGPCYPARALQVTRLTAAKAIWPRYLGPWPSRESR